MSGWDLRRVISSDLMLKNQLFVAEKRELAALCVVFDLFYFFLPLRNKWYLS